VVTAIVTATPNPESTPAPTLDEEIARCILRAFEAKYGEVFDLPVELAMEFNGGKNKRRLVRVEDPQKEIWIIEVSYDIDVVTSTGKTIETEVWNEALFDITTGELTVSPEKRSMLHSLDVDTNLALNLKTECPDLPLN
jgi:hypothetical protein